MQDKRNYGLDIYRILCCIGVLTYHIMDDVLTCGGGWTKTLYFSASYCVPGFFLMSGYLLGQREQLSAAYVENKIAATIKKLFYWTIFWVVVHYLYTGELYDLWGNITAGANSEGVLPVAWFLFTYCFLLLAGYPMWHFMKKNAAVFCTLSFLWVVLLAFGFGRSLHDGRTQSLWLHLYAGYFALGMSFSALLYRINHRMDQRVCLIFALFISIAALAVYVSQVIHTERYRAPDQYYGTWFYSLWLTGMFWACMLIRVKNKRLQNLLKTLSKNTFVVYLGHFPLLLYFTGMKPLETTGMAVLYIIIFFASLEMLAGLFEKMPLLRKLI